MMVQRSTERYAHGVALDREAGIQWMFADSTLELYQAKLMVLHAACRIDKKLDFTAEVSMLKHFVANALNRIIDRALQGAACSSTRRDTPLVHMFQHARWARLADGTNRDMRRWFKRSREQLTYLQAVRAQPSATAACRVADSGRGTARAVAARASTPAASPTAAGSA
jgi:alkylation response protein AidB-like acyl-CoA dehydrogenase